MPREEIEITPAMIDAGVLELSRYNDNYERASDAVVRIYVEMEHVPRQANLQARQ